MNTNPNSKKRAQAARRRRRRRKIQPLKLLIQFAVAIFLIGIAVLGAGYALHSLQTKSDYDLRCSWENTEGSTSDVAIVSSVKAAPFANTLCVSDATKYYGELSTGENEKVCLMDLNNSNVMYAKNMYTVTYPASITKIMTALLCLEYGDMSQMVTIQASDYTLEEGAQVSGMIEGDTVSMDQLFHLLLIYSANDAGMAIARTIGGSVDGFVDLMNQKAHDLGMLNTHFMNPHGLHDEQHYTCAYDVYLMLNEAVKSSTFTEIMHQGSYTLNAHHADGSAYTLHYLATDKYLNGEQTAPEGVTVMGGKTGTTSQAGACLAILSQNLYGQPYISVILNASNKHNLYEDMSTLLRCINN